MRNTPGADSTISCLKMGDVKRISYKREGAKTVNLEANAAINQKKNTSLATTVPKFEVNLHFGSADR